MGSFQGKYKNTKKVPYDYQTASSSLTWTRCCPCQKGGQYHPCHLYRNHNDHHQHVHGDIVAHVSGDVDAQILLLPGQVEGDVVHVPGGGVVDHHLDEYHDQPFMFCVVAEFPSVESSEARLAVDDEAGVKSNHLVVIVLVVEMRS